MTEKKIAKSLGYFRLFWNTETESIHCCMEKITDELKVFLEEYKEEMQDIIAIAKFLAGGNTGGIMHLNAIPVDNDVIELTDTDIGETAVFIADFKSRTVNAKINYSFHPKNFYMRKMKGCPKGFDVVSYYDKDMGADERSFERVLFFIINWNNRTVWSYETYMDNGIKIKTDLFPLIEAFGSVEESIRWMQLKEEYRQGEHEYFEKIGFSLAAGFKD